MKNLVKITDVMVGGLVALGATLSLGAQVVINDPVAYWSFDDQSGLLSNQVSSVRYHDASVIKGQPASGLSDGGVAIVGNAMVLDGASGIRLPYHQDNLGASFTISLWYWQATNNTRQCVYQSRDNWVASYETASFNSTFSSHVGQSYAGNTTTELKEWVHLTHTFATVENKTTLSVYTNGVFQFAKEVQADNVFIVNQLRGLHVGVTRDKNLDGGRCFKGMIDELALWERPLSADEVLALYQRGAGGQKLEFTVRAAPTIKMTNGQLEFNVLVDENIPEGMLYNGWLLAPGTDQPGSVTDTAGAATAEVGSILADTAGHAEGPFNAEKIASTRWKVPLTEASALKQMPRGNFTVEAWFRTTFTQQNVLIGTYPGTGAGVVNLQLEKDSEAMLYWRKNKDTTAERIQVKPPWNLRGRDGGWHHLAGVMSNTTAHLYMDGVLIGCNSNVTAGAFDLGGSHLYIGQDGRQNWGLFNGEIGDARLWERALSSTEIATLAAFGRPGGSVCKNGLLAEYALYNPNPAMRVSPAGYQVDFTPRLRQIPQTNFTYEVKFRTTDAGRGILVGNYKDDDTYAFNNLELYTDNKIRFYQKASPGNYLYVSHSAGSVDTRDGAWHRIAAVRRDQQLFIYLDGRQLGEARDDTLGAYSLTGGSLGIGRDLRWPAFPLNGVLEQARIWKRALTADELAGLASSNAVPLAGLVAEYAPFPTNTLRTAGFPGERFLRTWTSGTNTTALLFSGLPRHNKIGVGMLLAQLDSLDPLLENNHFAIRVDGAEVLSVGLGPDQGREAQVSTLRLFGKTVDVQVFKDTLTLGGQELFDCGQQWYGIGRDSIFKDHVYDLTLLEALQEIPHTKSELVVELLGVQGLAGENEGFGIDKIRVTVYPQQGTLITIM